MAYEFKLPDLGEGVQEGEITHWLVHEGERVEENQPLVEVMTDKVTVEIPSPRAGTILEHRGPRGGGGPRRHAPGDHWRRPRPGGAARLLRTSNAPPLRKAAEVSGNGEGRRALAVPAVRRLAQDLGVDIEHVARDRTGR